MTFFSQVRVRARAHKEDFDCVLLLPEILGERELKIKILFRAGLD
jgi:hypothetical protein